MNRRICCVEGCGNLAKSKGARNGKRRYGSKCDKHARPNRVRGFRVRKKRYRAGVMCWCAACDKRFRRRAPWQVCCGRGCQQVLRLRGRKITLRAQNCRMCGVAMNPRKGKLCCSPRCRGRLANQRRKGGKEPVKETVPYYYRHRQECIDRAKRYAHPEAAKRWAAEHPERAKWLAHRYRNRHKPKISRMARERVAALTDGYIKQILVSELDVKRFEIPPEILELKREQLRLLRAARKREGGKNNAHKRNKPSDSRMRVEGERGRDDTRQRESDLGSVPDRDKQLASTT
jgi:hypothetical protein